VTFTFQSESFPFASEAPLELDRVLKARYPEASWSRLRALIESGKLFVDDAPVRDARFRVAPGATVKVQMTAPRPKAGTELADSFVRFHDRDVVVVEKPEGLSSMTHEGENQSADRLLESWLTHKQGRRSAAVHVVHRLDKVTSGVMVFALHREALLDLKGQFREHSVGRYYLAVANGEVHPGTLKLRIVRDRGDGLRGITRDPREGVHSVTHVEVLEPLARTTLIRCKLETGRTHQIRIHLAHTGHPLVGEPLYAKGVQGSFVEAPRLMLHAAHLSFVHPRTRARLSFDSELPDAFQRFLQAERALAKKTR
jgi:23S rRNA pseudouridine1911/1915/1917 synthase